MRKSATKADSKRQFDSSNLSSISLMMTADTSSPLWRSFFDAWLTLAITRSSDEEIKEYKALLDSGESQSLWQRLEAKVGVQDQRNIANIVGGAFAEIVAKIGGDQ